MIFNKVQPKKLIPLVFFLLFILAGTIIVTQAYVLFGYQMKGSWQDEYYYISEDRVTYNGQTVNYGTIATAAVREWNSAVDRESGHTMDIDLSKTSNGSATTTRIVFSPLDRGAIGWVGFTYYYDYNSLTGWSIINPDQYPTRDYQSASVIINLFSAHTLGTTKIKNVMMHEMGHAFGLAHPPTGTTNSLMRRDIASVSTSVPPQPDDIAGVRSIYE